MDYCIARVCQPKKVLVELQQYQSVSECVEVKEALQQHLLSFR